MATEKPPQIVVSIGKSARNSAFSIAMFDYQRVEYWLVEVNNVLINSITLLCLQTWLTEKSLKSRHFNSKIVADTMKTACNLGGFQEW